MCMFACVATTMRGSIFVCVCVCMYVCVYVCMRVSVCKLACVATIMSPLIPREYYQTHNEDDSIATWKINGNFNVFQKLCIPDYYWESLNRSDSL
jgi:hypothetical protein